jgi:hypothetical protein
MCHRRPGQARRWHILPPIGARALFFQRRSRRSGHTGDQIAAYASARGIIAVNGDTIAAGGGIRGPIHC